jgi:hypothetical protein
MDPRRPYPSEVRVDEVQQEPWRISPGYVVPAYERRWDHPLIKDNRIAAKFRPVAFNEPPFVGVAWRGPSPRPPTR